MVARNRFDRTRLNVANFNRNRTTVVTDGHVNDNCCVYCCRNGPKISLHTVNYKIAYNGRVTIIVLYAPKRIIILRNDLCARVRLRRFAGNPW